jgi:hypothetical protein
MRLTRWQWFVLGFPIVLIAGFLLISAGWQIHTWGINWIWAIFILVLLGWRWLLVKWTQPAVMQLETVIDEVNAELETSETTVITTGDNPTQQAENALQKIILASRNDPALWEDWAAFWQRCQDLVSAIAQIYYPQEKYPLLNIYIPQAYTLIRSTVDDLDQWMQKLSPVLNQVTLGQAYQAYETYQKLEPSARKLWRVWNWAQWILNPAAALARQASQSSMQAANQQLLGNFNQLLKEAALKNLCRNAIALYSSTTLSAAQRQLPEPKPTEAKTQTLREIIKQAQSPETVAEKPVNLLIVGRTGSGKSSLINTLFNAQTAEVDVLPSTDEIQSYHWETDTGETLTLWDTPGYEQVNRPELREIVLDYAHNADLLLLLTPALDPALQMDTDFLSDLLEEVPDLPCLTLVTQVDRLRPVRECQPPYDWREGESTKEKNIRAAVAYRYERLANCNFVLPIVTADYETNRPPWNSDTLALTLLEEIDPAKQLRLARFLRDQEAKAVGAAKIIDHYTFQMATTQGLTAFLKSPVLSFLSTLSTGSPQLAYLLAEQIPIEQLPIVIGKLQMAYDLFKLLEPEGNFDFLSLWSLLRERSTTPQRDAWALGHALVEYWTQGLGIDQLRERYQHYLEEAPQLPAS